MIFPHRCRISCVIVLSILHILLSEVFSYQSISPPTNSVLTNTTNSTQICTVTVGDLDSFLVLVPALLLGSNYVLLKRYNRGDGVFFQWIVCAGVWLCGLCVHFIQSSPHFYAIATLGGVIWALGNFLLIPMLRLVGFHTGLLMWSLVFMLSGWFTGFLNLMGQHHEELCVPFFNYGGVVMCISGVILLAFLRVKRSAPNVNSNLGLNYLANTALYNIKPVQYYDPQMTQLRPGYKRWDILGRLFDRLSPLKRKVIGYLLSILMGVSWGTHFVPLQFLESLSMHNKYYSSNWLDYTFPYSTGAFITSTFLFVFYSIYRLNKPQVLPQSVLPALAVGILTGVAISLWAHLNATMSPAITFPVIASGTSTIGALSSVIVYRGRNNLIIFFVAVSVILSGIILLLISQLHLIHGVFKL